MLNSSLLLHHHLADLSGYNGDTVVKSIISHLARLVITIDTHLSQRRLNDCSAKVQHSSGCAIQKARNQDG